MQHRRVAGLAALGAAVLWLSACVPQAETGQAYQLTRVAGADRAQQSSIHAPDGSVIHLDQRIYSVEAKARLTRALSADEAEGLRAAAVHCEKGAVSNLNERQKDGTWLFTYDCLTT